MITTALMATRGDGMAHGGSNQVEGTSAWRENLPAIGSTLVTDNWRKQETPLVP
jgi:hypothetical protein